MKEFHQGRRPLTDRDATLLRDLDALVEPMARGDPQSPLRWTCKSTLHLADELARQGHHVSQRTLCDLLRQLHYSLQITHSRTIIQCNKLVITKSANPSFCINSLPAEFAI